MVLDNTLGCTIYVDSIVGTASYKGVAISTIDIQNANIVVPAHSTILTGTYEATVDGAAISLIIDLANDPTPMLNISAFQTGYIEDYPLALYVDFTNVPANITCVPVELCYPP